MNAPTLAPVAEVRRLRADLDAARRQLAEIHGLVLELAAADMGPVIGLNVAVRWAGQARATAYAAGVQAGRLQVISEVKATQTGLVLALARSAPHAGDTWLVLCGDCRHNGRQPGCTRCEGRTRETFARPHPDDYPGRAA